MSAYIWPIALVIVSNIIYQICAKEVPSDMDGMASLILTYAVSTVTVVVLFFALGSAQGGLFAEYSKLNWAPIALGISAVGLEAGYIFAFKNGWEISKAFVVQASILAVMLIFVGVILYKESLTWNKLAGIALCVAGLILINRKESE